MLNLPLALMFFAFASLMALVVAVPVALFLLVRHREGERSRPLGRLASTLGLAFHSKLGPLPAELRGSFPFDAGFSGKVFNLMIGAVAGTELLVCDFASLTTQGGIQQRRSGFSPHQVAAFRLHVASPSATGLENLRRDARASVFRIEVERGWLIASRSGLVPPDAMPSFVADAARALALVDSQQGEAVVLAVDQACAGADRS